MSMAFMMLSSLRMQATITTLAGFPAAYQAFSECVDDGMANWTPTGFARQMFRTVGRHATPPPDIPPPSQWGDEAIVRKRLHDRGFTNGETNLSAQVPFPPSEVVEFYRVYFGPVNHTFLALDADEQAVLQR